MSYPYHDPYQQGNVHGVIPSSLNNSNSDAVQVSHGMSLTMITEGLPVHANHLFKAATIR
jgi:hypothetical protein